jgi:anti-sigma factor RsiW
MDCRMIQGDLVAFTFGTRIGAGDAAEPADGASNDEARRRIDAHLLTCTDCLRAYLRFKHQVEHGASLDVRPSDAIRRRIREDVAAAVRPRGAARVLRSLRRPIPLYQGLAVACVAAGVALASPWLRDVMSARHPAVAEARVDTSRAIAESLTVY